jgi:hypothetical protein
MRRSIIGSAILLAMLGGIDFIGGTERIVPHMPRRANIKHVASEETSRRRRQMERKASREAKRRAI